MHTGLSDIRMSLCVVNSCANETLSKGFHNFGGNDAAIINYFYFDNLLCLYKYG